MHIYIFYGLWGRYTDLYVNLHYFYPYMDTLVGANLGATGLWIAEPMVPRLEQPGHRSQSSGARQVDGWMLMSVRGRKPPVNSASYMTMLVFYRGQRWRAGIPIAL